MIGHVTFKNSSVRYSDKGKGNVIVLLHGFLESLHIWDNFSDCLSKQFRVISIDLLGHGETPCIGYIHTMELMAECLKSVMDSLDIKKFVLAGHSMGGYVALSFYEKYPHQIAGLCLFHSTAMPDSEKRKIDRDRMVLVVKQNRRQFVSDLIPKLFAKENISKNKNDVTVAKQIAMNTSKQGTVAALKGMKERSSKELVLKNAVNSVLFIIGKKDVILAWENLLLLATLPKQPVTVVLENAGHMGFYEAPDETVAALENFARTCYSL